MLKMLNLDFNEIMIFILAVIFYGFMTTMKELDKDYNKFSEEDRKEAKGIIGVPSGKRGITTLRIFLTIYDPFIFNA